MGEFAVELGADPELGVPAVGANPPPADLLSLLSDGSGETVGPLHSAQVLEFEMGLDAVGSLGRHTEHEVAVPDARVCGEVTEEAGHAHSKLDGSDQDVEHAGLGGRVVDEIDDGLLQTGAGRVADSRQRNPCAVDRASGG